MTESAEFPEYANGKLYVFSSSTGPSHCEWLPVVPEYAPLTEKLIRRTVILPAADHSWEWELQLQSSIPSIVTFTGGPYSWNDPDDCHFSVIAAGCDDPDYNLIGDVFPLEDVTLVTVPWYLCTDDQVQAWPVS